MTKRLTWRTILGIFIGLGLIANHVFVLNQSDDWASPLNLLDRFFDLGLLGVFGLTALGVGQRILRVLGWASDSIGERVAFAFGVGTSVQSLFLILIGLLGLLYAPVILFALALAFGLTARDWLTLIRLARQTWQARAPFALAEKLLVVALGALLAPILLGALTPTTDVDALNYHLVAPALFLKSHAVVPSFDNIGINYPIGMDILYLFGLAAGTDIFAPLVHFSFAVMLSVGVYAFAAQYWTRLVGIFAAFIFWSSSVVGLSASIPLLDLGLTLYEFLALWSFLRWRASHHSRELAILGLMLGGALANKYLAAVICVLLGALIVLESVFRFSQRRAVFKHALIVAGCAALIAAPWYLKNWVWLTSPLYPLFSGDYGLDGLLHPPAGYLGGVGDWTGLGLGTDLGALVMFPINLYLKWQYFGSPLNRGGPSLFFFFLPLYFIARKQPITQWLWLICAIRFAFWWQHTQNIRYLIAIFPLLSILSASVIGDLLARARRTRIPLTVVLSVFALLAIMLEWGFLFVLRENALGFVTGQISRTQYLEANLLNYPVARFINTHLPDAHILALGDQRIYYITSYVNPDDPHRNWLEWMAIGNTPEGMARFARDVGITHVWVSQDDLAYFRNYVQIDSPFGASAAVFAELRAHYLEQIYADERGHVIYAVRP